MFLNRFVMGLALAVALGAAAHSQSLDIRNPTPLAPGENKGSLDSMVGPQYWLIHCHKGKLTISLRFSSMGLFGNARRTTILEVLHESNGKILGSRSVTSTASPVENDWPGTCDHKSTMTVELDPPSNTLVRAGGDYTIAVSGDGVDFPSGAGGGPDRIVGTYAVMVCAPDWECSGLSIHFAPDGTVRLTDGHTGTWSAFDPDAMIYSVVIGPDRYSLKLMPGRGLFGTNDLSVPIFQAVR